MSRIRVSIFLIFLSLSIGHAQQKPLIDHFQSDSIEVVLDGCECRLSNAKNAKGYVFISRVGGEDAWMSIAGATVHLEIVTSDESDSNRDIFTRNYKAPGLSVRVRMQRITTPHDPNSESEGFQVKATITVQKGSQKQIIQVFGLCGC